MTVYVDESIWPYRGTKYCHMMVGKDDDLQELHDFAASIGLKRAWFQDRPTHPHYDLSPTKRALAVRNGATEVKSLEIGYLCIRRPKPKTLGRFLANARIALHRSQREVAADLGMSGEDLNNIEFDRRLPTHDELAQLVYLLNIDRALLEGYL